MNNFAELQLLPMMEFSFNTLPRWFSIASLLKCVSDFTTDLFFSSRKEFFSWTYLLKKTPRRTKILIFPVWNKILKIWDTHFEHIRIKVQCSKNYFKIFLAQEAGAFRNNIAKEPQISRPKLKKYVYYIFTENICSSCNPMQVVVFCKNVLIL